MLERWTSEQLVAEVLRRIDGAPRDGTLKTPARVVRSWEELYRGYKINVPSLFTAFEEDGCDEMVVLRNVEFFSTCEHHLLPFHGHAHIGYVPRDRVIGISKLARLLDAFSRRLQIQERIGKQVADAIMEHLHPLGCGVILEAQHLCMAARGVLKHESIMTTSTMRGVFRDKPEARAEFLGIIRG